MNDPLEYVIEYLREQLDCNSSIRFFMNTNSKQPPMLRVKFVQYPFVTLALSIKEIERAIELLSLEGACQKLEDELVIALYKYRQAHPEQF